MTRTSPRCSTTKRSFGEPGAAATWTGASKLPTRFSFSPARSKPAVPAPPASAPAATAPAATDATNQRLRGPAGIPRDPTAPGSCLAAGRHEPVHRAAQRDRVVVAGSVHPEGAQLRHVEPELRIVLSGRARGRDEAAQGARAEVAVEVAAIERRQGAVADHIAAGHRAVAPRPRILEHGRHRVRRLLVLVEALRPLERRPAEVELGAEVARVDRVDLLPRVLADIADPQASRRCVEGKAPRVSQADRRELVGAGARRVEAKQLAERALGVLRRALRVAGAPTVTHPEVELVVGAEEQQATVVVGGEVLDAQELPGASP